MTKLERYIKKYSAELSEECKQSGYVYDLIHNNDTGEWCWAISSRDDCWLNAFETKKAAVAWIKEVGIKCNIGKRMDR